MKERILHILHSTLKGNPAVQFTIGRGWGYGFRQRELAHFLWYFGNETSGHHMDPARRGLILFYRSDQVVNSWRMILSEVRLALLAIGPFRLYRVLRRAALIRKKKSSFGTHIHCWYMGIPSEDRSLNTAAALRDLLFEEADRQQLPVLAETTIVRNRQAFERMGFQVYDLVHTSGLTTFLLCRMPR